LNVEWREIKVFDSKNVKKEKGPHETSQHNSKCTLFELKKRLLLNHRKLRIKRKERKKKRRV
jgi:hypothetical protein